MTGIVSCDAVSGTGSTCRLPRGHDPPHIGADSSNSEASIWWMADPKTPKPNKNMPSTKSAKEMSDEELGRAWRYFDVQRMEGPRLTASEDRRWYELDAEFQRRGGV